MTVIGVVGQFKFCLMFILVHKFRSFLFSEENIPLTNLVTSKRMKTVKFRILLPTLLISVNKVSDNATWKWGVCRRRRESLNMKSWKVDNFRYENFSNSWIPQIQKENVLSHLRWLLQSNISMGTCLFDFLINITTAAAFRGLLLIRFSIYCEKKTFFCRYLRALADILHMSFPAPTG